MSLKELRTDRKVIGSKQVKKAIAEGKTQKVYLAVDAEPHITIPLKELCAQYGVLLEQTYTMKELGMICEIEVGAAAVALLQI